MAETLQEFALKLGFVVDKGQEARFTATLAGLAKTIAGVAASLTAAASAISGTVIAVASSFDQLYFAAQRTNASVASIKSLSYALSQVGGSSEQALAAIEGVASAMRTNPGTEALLNQLGVATRENGRLRETGGIIDDIVSSLSKRPYYVSTQIAAVLGLPDEKAWNTFTTQWPKIREVQKEYEKSARAFGLDPDKAAESSNRLMTSFRGLMSTVDLLMQKITIELQPILTRYLEAIAKWVQEHQTEIVAALERIVRVAADLASAFGSLVSAMEPVVATFASLAKTLGSDKDGLQWALEGVLVFMAMTWVPKMLGFLGKVGGMWAMIALALGYALHDAPAKLMKSAGFGTAALGPGESTAPVGSGDPFNQYMDKGGAWGQFKSWVKGKLGMGGNAGAAKTSATRANMAGVDPSLMAAIDAASKETPYGVRLKSGFRSGDPRLHGMGLAADVELFDKATGKPLADYQTPETAAAYKAYADRVKAAYEAQNPGKSGELRWGGYFGGGKGTYGALDLMHFDVGGRRGMPMGGGSWGGGFSPEMQRIWGIDADGKMRGIGDKSSSLFDAAPLGGSVNRSASLSQKTDIVIYGSTDPAGTAANLGGAQGRIASELLRNGQSAFA